MKFKTAEKSYEVDLWGRRVRWANRNDPFLHEQSWKSYYSISVPSVGDRVVMVWNQLGLFECTSNVVEISDEDDSDRSFFMSLITSIGNGGGVSC